MLRVVSLCAQWCSACRAWRPVSDAVAARHPHIQWQWLDIEDEAALMDSVGLDIETFPTLLVARGPQPLFLGPIAPQAATLESLVAHLGRADATAQRLAPEAGALAARLWARAAAAP